LGERLTSNYGEQFRLNFIWRKPKATEGEAGHEKFVVPPLVHRTRFRGGGVDLLTRLLQQELHAGTPSDAVVLFGPPGRTEGPSARELAQSRPDHPEPRFYYFQYSPYTLAWVRRAGGLVRANPLPFDGISRLVAPLQGKTIAIRSPGEFAKAIEQVEKR